jgi:phosphatidylserine/phosphatidylglycerophosphate/cardiolipin synthase-like enzyme
LDNEKIKEALPALKELVDNEDNVLLIDYLHAKIYINDNAALLTSMNFNDDAYNKSLDFGIITESKEEYDNVIGFCEDNIFFYSKKKIIDYFHEKGIGVKFGIYGDKIAECNDWVNYLKLEKDKDTYIRCSVKNVPTEEAYSVPYDTVFVFEIMKNGEDYKLPNRRYKRCQHGGYFIPLSIDSNDERLYKNHNQLLIPVLNKYKDETLKILMDVCDCLNE